MKEIKPEEFVGPDRIRFWSKVSKRGPNECWLWNAGKTGQGYGAFIFRGKGTTASRVAYILTFGEISDEAEVCHDCPGGDNRACCNPAHLWLGTHKENMVDALVKGRKIAKGEQIGPHKLTEEQVLQIRQRVKNGERKSDLAREFKIAWVNIWMIVQRRHWKHI